MNIEHHKWSSPALEQEMELKVYGHTGKPVLVFPAQGGRFFEFEDFGMVAACRDFVERGNVTFYTVDSIDNQSWANANIPPAERARRHEDYDRYIVQEVLPFMRGRSMPQKFWTTGCSMGGYHSANFFFRHPDLFDGVISLSGLFQLRLFVGNYVDDAVYFNSPLLYLPNLIDAWYLDQYRQSRIIVCAGQGTWEEAALEDMHQLEVILNTKQIPAWIDRWGSDVNHDWPWWRKQLPYFLDRLVSQ